MDRSGLTPGAELKLNTDAGYITYTIRGEVNRGGSCIVYDASYTDTLGNFKLVRIKECYPHALRIDREPEGALRVRDQDAEAFGRARGRVIAAYQINHELFMTGNLTNFVANTSNIYEANNTVYIVSVYLNGKTFAEYQGKNLHDCLSLLLSVTNTLHHIHEAGFLYLDLKPDNILTIDGSSDLVQLFDFDSMIAMEEVKKSSRTYDFSGFRLSYTKGYAPLEQRTGHVRQLGKYSDLYSLGAVLFYALWRRTPDSFDCEAEATYDYDSSIVRPNDYRDALFRELTTFFHKTLASYYADRYQDASEAIAQLKRLLLLSDETKPWICSTPVSGNIAFYGRRDELNALTELLAGSEHGVVNLFGMGGIGKSTLVRQYLKEYGKDWEAVLWISDRGNLAESIADDELIRVNTVLREQHEEINAYLRRKLRILSEIAGEQRILLVIDNFACDHLDQLKSFVRIGWTILLISRERTPEGLYPSMPVQEMPENDLAALFCRYAHCDLTDETDQRAFRRIIALIGRHTLMTELIARQIAGSYLDLQSAEAMLTGLGLSELPAEKIDYVRDQAVYHESLLKILDRLTEIDAFSVQERCCLKLLSLFDAPGIRIDLYRELAALESLDFLNQMEAAGWVKIENRKVYLHQMMREYIRTWAWSKEMETAVDRMMRNLYSRIRPAEKRHDGSKQFPADYEKLHELLWIAEQLVGHTGRISKDSQYLLFRILIDAPVDEDQTTLQRIMALLQNPEYLDAGSVLRLYETAAYLEGRLHDPESAIEILYNMKEYLKKHPSMYYRSAWHRAMAIILHNEDPYVHRDECLRHQDQAILAARCSTHPEAKKQLAACLLSKAQTLITNDLRGEKVWELIREAEPLVEKNAGPLDEERYHLACILAMLNAENGNAEEADSYLRMADEIAYAGSDSDLSIVDHLVDQAAVIRMVMGDADQAVDAARQAIKRCEQHPDSPRYKEACVEAYELLGIIYEHFGQYAQSKEAYEEAGKRLSEVQ